MSLRYENLPSKIRAQIDATGVEPAATPRRRRKPRTITMRCTGVGGCGATLTGTYASIERHADAHHVARLEWLDVTAPAG